MSPKTLLSGALLLGALTIATSSSAQAAHRPTTPQAAALSAFRAAGLPAVVSACWTDLSNLPAYRRALLAGKEAGVPLPVQARWLASSMYSQAQDTQASCTTALNRVDRMAVRGQPVARDAHDQVTNGLVAAITAARYDASAARDLWNNNGREMDAYLTITAAAYTQAAQALRAAGRDLGVTLTP